MKHTKEHGYIPVCIIHYIYIIHTNMKDYIYSCPITLLRLLGGIYSSMILSTIPIPDHPLPIVAEAAEAVALLEAPVLLEAVVPP